MKIYTEEELRKHLYNHDERFFEELTPIELPSDEDIEKALPDGFPHSDGYDAGKICGFEEGAKWMKEQLLQPNYKNEEN